VFTTVLKSGSGLALVVRLFVKIMATYSLARTSMVGVESDD